MTFVMHPLGLIVFGCDIHWTDSPHLSDSLRAWKRRSTTSGCPGWSAVGLEDPRSPGPDVVVRLVPERMEVRSDGIQGSSDRCIAEDLIPGPSDQTWVYWLEIPIGRGLGGVQAGRWSDGPGRCQKGTKSNQKDFKRESKGFQKDFNRKPIGIKKGFKRIKRTPIGIKSISKGNHKETNRNEKGFKREPKLSARISEPNLQREDLGELRLWLHRR